MSNRQQTVDTPMDANIRDEQKRIRLAIANQPDRNPEQGAACFNESFIFRLRQYKNTSFAGLWELVALDKKGNIIEMIMDADALPHNLEAISNIMANKGF
jgi:hypothetical protein